MPSEERGQVKKHDERVSWTLTGNLGTKDPATAARVMAAYAMNAEDLKRQAGVSKRGTPITRGSVMHYTLSWKEGEVEGLTKRQMQRAAVDSLKVLGKDTTKGKRVPKNGGRRQFADEHQYVIVAHNDRKHPHVHVVVNLTHPEHGVRLPTGNDYNKLSSWALKFEKANGKILCPERVENRKARRWSKAQGKYTRFVKAEKRLNRKDYEHQKAIQDSQAKTALQQKQLGQLEQLKKYAHQQKRTHSDELAKLNPELLKKLQAVREETAGKLRQQRKAIIKKANLGLKKLLNEFAADKAEYELREQTLLGRLENTWAAIKHKGWGNLDTQADRSLFSIAFREIYQLHADPKARSRPIDEKHDQKEAEHHRKVDLELAAAEKRIHAQKSEQLQRLRHEYQQRREQLEFRQRGEQAKMSATWLHYREQCKEQWQQLRREQSNLPHHDKEVAAKTKPEHLLPQEGSSQAAKQIDQYLEGLKKRLQLKEELERDAGTEKGDDGRGR